jgi:acetyltransferase-like isoleucine patch superfamily enzyme
VDIGDHVLAAPQMMIVPYQHIFGSREKLIREQGGLTERVVVEDDVYLGMSVRVLCGVTIGRGAVVGAGAVVRKDIPPYAVAVGLPARVIRYRQERPS